uniref:Albumin domain-containing protein n=1 Tax=Podarcis muralis TaxID=64176 RepID=A0A670JIT4_PODMU
MKWVTFISFLFLASLAASKHLPRRYRHAGHQDTIAQATEVTPDEFRGIALVISSQALQQATYEEVSKVKNDIVELQKKCAADEKSDPECTKPLGTVFLDEFCHEQEIIAKYGFADCCAKVDPERKDCILAHKNGTPGFIPPFQKPSAEEGCKAFEADPDQTMGRYVYEIARRYPFSKTSSIFAGARKYKEVLTTCCKEADKDACFTEKEAELKKHISDTLEVMKKNCELHATAGDYLFQNESLCRLLVHYTKKAPQLTFDQLYEYTKGLTKAAAKCCHEDEAHKLPCAEKYVSFVLGEICREHEMHHINKQVCKCCGDSLTFRRECFSGLGPDPEYQPTPFAPDLFTFHPDLCTADPEVLKRKKQKQLVDLIKHKPTITDEQLAGVVVDFQGMNTQCCEDADSKTCFEREGPKLVERSRAVFGEQ